MASAKIQVSIASGGFQTGGVVATSGQTVAPQIINSAGVTAYTWEIYDFPPAFTLPTGWLNVGGVYTSNAPTPTAFTLASGANGWGPYMLRLRINNNPLQFDATTGAPNASFVQGNTDESTIVVVLSPNCAMPGVAYNLGSQLDASWSDTIQRCFRLLDAAATGGSAVTWANDLSGSGSTHQYVGSISGVGGAGGDVPLTAGARITAASTTHAYIDLSAAASNYGYFKSGTGGFSGPSLDAISGGITLGGTVATSATIGNATTTTAVTASVVTAGNFQVSVNSVNSLRVTNSTGTLATLALLGATAFTSDASNLTVAATTSEIFAIGGTTVATLTSSALSLAVPLSGSSASSGTPLQLKSSAIALTNANVTLSAAQIATPRLAFTGTLTGSVQVIFPNAAGLWLANFAGLTFGAFTVTLKSGTGSVVLSASTVTSIGFVDTSGSNGIAMESGSGGSIAWAGDLAGSSGASQYVVSLYGAGGTGGSIPMKDSSIIATSAHTASIDLHLATDGTMRANGLLSPSLDTATVVSMALGGTNANQVTIGNITNCDGVLAYASSFGTFQTNFGSTGASLQSDVQGALLGRTSSGQIGVRIAPLIGLETTYAGFWFGANALTPDGSNYSWAMSSATSSISATAIVEFEANSGTSVSELALTPTGIIIAAANSGTGTTWTGTSITHTVPANQSHDFQVNSVSSMTVTNPGGSSLQLQLLGQTSVISDGTNLTIQTGGVGGKLNLTGGSTQGMQLNSTSVEVFLPLSGNTGGTPLGFTSSAISISGANVTLSSAQIATPNIVLSGTLTNNRQLIFPNSAGFWLINLLSFSLGGHTLTLSSGSANFNVTAGTGTIGMLTVVTSGSNGIVASNTAI